MQNIFKLIIEHLRINLISALNNPLRVCMLCRWGVYTHGHFSQVHCDSKGPICESNRSVLKIIGFK